MEPRYNPHEIEKKTYKYWLDNGCFDVNPDPNKKPFTISMPPPNVTGQLHMGHALDQTLQDVLTRAKRMQGYAALWLPGTDHAGIATQIKVEEALRENEGKTRHDLGREKFLERVWDWKNQYGNRIVEQIKRMGSSCDWSRLRFTMDSDYADAVLDVFVSLYEKGLIYQGNRIINWCPKCTTALSDAEVEHTEHEGTFWHIKYPVEGSDEFIIIATTRPETLLGDTAVAVSFDDPRYKHLIGKNLILPLVGRKIPVVGDEHADAELGTGAVKITPAHDPNDFEVGLRNNLEVIKVLDDLAIVNENGGKYAGLDRYEARKQIVADLEEAGLLVKIEPHAHNVGECYRCSTIVEPIVSKQWFVKMAPLAKDAISAVTSGDIEFIPSRFSKTYLNWMENVHDWCISRQLWWGHRIPAFYCDSCGETTVAREEVHSCPKCGGAVHQDEDVLDTWFSSALWPFATLGYPNNTADLSYFYPNSVLVTGYDIIFFWVARMIFSGLHHTGKKPFDKVLIHGIVRDGEGRKMSKSLGNGIDPLEIIDEYGADALRAQLISGNAPGNDMRFYTSRTEASRNFANKLWNAARFVLMNKSENNNNSPESADTKDINQLYNDFNLSKLTSAEDKWIVSKCNRLTREVTENIDKFELGIAFGKVYDFIWDEFCDWYIEMVKPRIIAGDTLVLNVLTDVLMTTIKLLHPFMPFITEEIYQNFGGDGSIMLAKFPEYSENRNFPEDEAEIEVLKDVITQIRNYRAEIGAHPAKKAKLYIDAQTPDAFKAEFFKKLAFAEEIEFSTTSERSQNLYSFSFDGGVISMETGNLVDTDEKRRILEKDISHYEKELELCHKQLNNPSFIEKAPAAKVEEWKVKLKNNESALEIARKQLNEL